MLANPQMSLQEIPAEVDQDEIGAPTSQADPALITEIGLCDGIVPEKSQRKRQTQRRKSGQTMRDTDPDLPKMGFGDDISWPDRPSSPW